MSAISNRGNKSESEKLVLSDEDLHTQLQRISDT